MQPDLNFGNLGLNTPNQMQGHMKSNPKQSLQLISHQMRLYSSVRGLCGLSYTCFSGPRVLEQFGKLGPNTPNHAQGHTKRNPKTPAPHLTSNEVLLLCQSHLMVQLYLFYGYLSIRAMWENRAQIPHQIIWSDTWKVMQQLEPDTPSHGYVIQSVKLHISHQMKSYSNVKAIWESIYTCFCVPVELGQVRETRPKLPKSWASIHRVIQSVKFHISHQVKPYSNVKVICRSGCTCFSIFGELWQVRKIGPKFPIS